MNKEETRKEVLELLARGKISIDEAVTLFDQTAPETVDSAKSVTQGADDLPLKVVVDVDVDIDKETTSKSDFDLDIEDIPVAVDKTATRQPRWLRIHVGDLDTGKSKVKVNVPFGMVKFGLGMAQIFAPKEYSANLDQIGTMIAESNSGLLVDVQDAESNEHVRIYVE